MNNKRVGKVKLGLKIKKSYNITMPEGEKPKLQPPKPSSGPSIKIPSPSGPESQPPTGPKKKVGEHITPDGTREYYDESGVLQMRLSSDKTEEHYSGGKLNIKILPDGEKFYYDKDGEIIRHTDDRGRNVVRISLPPKPSSGPAINPPPNPPPPNPPPQPHRRTEEAESENKEGKKIKRTGFFKRHKGKIMPLGLAAALGLGGILFGTKRSEGKRGDLKPATPTTKEVTKMEVKSSEKAPADEGENLERVRAEIDKRLAEKQTPPPSVASPVATPKVETKSKVETEEEILERARGKEERGEGLTSAEADTLNRKALEPRKPTSRLEPEAVLRSEPAPRVDPSITESSGTYSPYQPPVLRPEVQDLTEVHPYNGPGSLTGDRHMREAPVRPIENYFGLSKERLEKVELAYENNIEKIFGDKLKDWKKVKNEDAYEFTVYKKVSKKRLKIREHLIELIEKVDLRPSSGVTGKTSTIEEFIRRLLQKAEAGGILEEVTLK